MATCNSLGSTNISFVGSFTSNGSIGNFCTLNITGNTSVTLPTSGTLAINSWIDVTGTSQTIAVNINYIADNASLVTFTLPTTAVQGTNISICGNGAGGWLIAQNSLQNIKFNGQTTTTGVGGSLASTNRYDQINLVCTVGNNTWVVHSVIGNITVV